MIVRIYVHDINVCAGSCTVNAVYTRDLGSRLPGTVLHVVQHCTNSSRSTGAGRAGQGIRGRGPRAPRSSLHRSARDPIIRCRRSSGAVDVARSLVLLLLLLLPVVHVHVLVLSSSSRSTGAAISLVLAWCVPRDNNTHYYCMIVLLVHLVVICFF